MIASLHGTVESFGTDHVIVSVNGVGFLVYLPTSVLSVLGAKGEEVHLHTHMHVKEDDISLYGFSTADELQIFETLIGVSKLGPKLALAMLSAMNVDQLSMAIASGSTDLLTSISGIGKKMADRIVLELKDKIGAGLIAAPVAQMTKENSDVLAALTSLGYSVAEATRAVVALPAANDMTLEDRIMLALQYFGSKK